MVLLIKILTSVGFDVVLIPGVGIIHSIPQIDVRAPAFSVKAAAVQKLSWRAVRLLYIPLDFAVISDGNSNQFGQVPDIQIQSRTNIYRQLQAGRVSFK